MLGAAATQDTVRLVPRHRPVAPGPRACRGGLGSPSQEAGASRGEKPLTALTPPGLTPPDSGWATTRWYPGTGSGHGSGGLQRRRRFALVTTDRELSAIAAAAIIGLSRSSTSG